jgi:signal transduction histidine kinase/methyl-accepting chemotaxis protein
MLVKQRLRINAVISVVSVLAILVVLFLTIYSVSRALETSKIADEIISASFERLMLRTDLQRTGSERTKIQLIAKHEQIGDLLKAASQKFSDPEDKKTISELLANHELIGKFSKTIRENREKRGPRAQPDALSQEIEDRLLSQLNMRVYDTILLGTKLQESGNQVVTSSLRLGGGGILFVLLLVSTFTLVNSRTMGRAITVRIGRLREGVAVIGVGNLDHRIDVKGNDEFADLSNAFNAMTEKLRRSYNDLENEIEVRKRAEEALHHLNIELERRVEEQTTEVRRANESLEQRIIERTAELHAANETLRASRVAALNLMEDADAARQQAENSRAELQGEVIERKRTQDMLITLNKDLENRIFQRTRFYSLLAAVNAEIVRQHDQQALFNEVCRIIVETGRFKLAWVGLVDPESREVRPVSSHGAIAYLEGIKIVAADTPEGRGPTGMAIVEDRHVSAPDFESDEKMAPWRERARMHGIRSSSAFPLRLGNQVIGALTIYSDQPSFFTVDEVALLLALSENLSFAIAAFEVEKERRAAVDALKKLNEDLELRVAHRTAELEFSNRELEAFIYSVSHDLRAPLRHISGFTKIIAEDYTDKFDEQGKEHLARIHNGAERMAHLIEDLLRLSRVSRQEMERETVDMSAIVSSLVADFREVDPDGSREVIIKEKISASVDRRLIKLALQNLVENAWKFTSKTQDPRIEFDAFEQEGKTVYRIRDNGVGFDPAYAGKMFLPFHRLHTESEFQGSGIGLAIVERVVQRHGGRIWAEGEVGKGATIYFTLE